MNFCWQKKMVPTLTIGREKGDKTAARFYLLFSAYGKLKTLVLMYNMYNFMCSLSCTMTIVFVFTFVYNNYSSTSYKKIYRCGGKQYRKQKKTVAPSTKDRNRRHCERKRLMLNPSSNSAMNSIAKNGEKIKNFETLKRNYEKTLASGQESGELMELATAVAYSVLNKCIDPQRGRTNRETVCDKGCNPSLVKLKQGIAADIDLIAKMQYAAENATKTEYNTDGEQVTTIIDKDAYNALSKLASENFSDGIDLVNTAALAILEQAAKHASGEKWLDTPYTVHRLAKKVYIKTPESAAYRDETTTPIQEIYRAVRREIMNSRAVQTDPRNGYTYIEDYTQDGLDEIYIRMGKYVDIGGYDSNGNYTATIESVHTYESILEKLNLTTKQATILQLRMQGNGYKAIATYLGITPAAVKNTVIRMRKQCEKIGFMPDGYKPKETDRKETESTEPQGGKQ